MIDEIELFNQVGLLYSSTAKQLYNLTLFTIGDQLSAQRITIDAFSEAYRIVADKSNIAEFRLRCVKQIYRYCKRDYKTVTYSINDLVQENAKNPGIVKKLEFLGFLSKQDVKERFLLLLYCQQRFTVKQIADVLRMPEFLVRHRFYRVLNMAGQYMD